MVFVSQALDVTDVKSFLFFSLFLAHLCVLILCRLHFIRFDGCAGYSSMRFLMPHPVHWRCSQANMFKDWRRADASSALLRDLPAGTTRQQFKGRVEVRLPLVGSPPHVHSTCFLFRSHLCFFSSFVCRQKFGTSFCVR